MGNAKQLIESGKAVLGIEFGSTRIKAVLVNEKNQPIASGGHDWENQLVDGIWTYSLDAIWAGVQDCYRDLVEDVKRQYGVVVNNFAAIGFSGMIHCLCRSGHGEIQSQGRPVKSSASCSDFIFLRGGALPICIRQF